MKQVRGKAMLTRWTIALAMVYAFGGQVLGARGAEEPPAKIPLYRAVPGWPDLPKTFSLGQVSGVATDSSDRVFVFHRGEHPILVFDREGKFLRSWEDAPVKKAHGLRIDREEN